jgi:hypothetical protein
LRQRAWLVSAIILLRHLDAHERIGHRPRLGRVISYRPPLLGQRPGGALPQLAPQCDRPTPLERILHLAERPQPAG